MFSTFSIKAFIYKLINKFKSLLKWDKWQEYHKFIKQVTSSNGKVTRESSYLLVEEKLKQAKGSIKAFLRINSSDLATWLQIVTEEEYFVVRKIINEYSHLKVKTIVDAGANVGLTSLYFNQIFPDARIIAIEPDEGNYNMLVRNTSEIENIRCIRAAFWPTNDNLTFDNIPFRDGREWAIRVKKVENSELTIKTYLSTITPSQVNNQLDNEGFDILKMDIEGAEAEFFINPHYCNELLALTRVLVIEIHPEFIEPLHVFIQLYKNEYYVFPGNEVFVACRKNLLTI